MIRVMLEKKYAQHPYIIYFQGLLVLADFLKARAPRELEKVLSIIRNKEKIIFNLIILIFFLAQDNYSQNDQRKTQYLIERCFFFKDYNA